MSLVLSLLLKANGKQAKSEVQSMREEITRTGSEARKLTPKLKAAETATGGLGRRFTSVTASLGKMRGSVRSYIAGLRGMDAAHKNSAGQVANITAQFNDIGVMLAAGQNPIQLALQQGTQLTQVFAQMGGGAAALRGVGAALISMINPVSLITLGSIAAGAAMVKWFKGAAQDAQALDDRLQSISDKIDNVRSLSSTSASDLMDAFGASDGDVFALYLAQFDAAEDNLLREARTLGAGMAEELRSSLGKGVLRGTRLDLAEMLGLEITVDEFGFNGARAEVNQILNTLSTVGTGSDIEGDIAMVQKLRSRIDEAATSAGRYTDQQAQWRDDLLATEAALSKALAAQTAAGTQALEIAKGIGATLVENLGTRTEEARTVAAFIAEQQRREEIERAIAAHGAQSAEVAKLRSEHERAAMRRQIEALTPAGTLRKEALAAFDAAQGIADANMQDAISAAADQAARLARNMDIALGKAMDALAGGNKDFADPRNEAGVSGVVFKYRPVPFKNKPQEPTRAASAGAGTERRAAEDLIARYQQELDILRETDPIKKEQIRNRELLATATEKERKTINDLIVDLDAENRALEQQQDLLSFIGQTSDTVFDAMAAGADGGKAALENLLVTLVKVAAQALLLGQGPLAGILGPNAGGASVTIPSVAAATGGLITGPGTGTSDSIMARLSNGEFVMNSASTRRHLPLLRALNSGVPGYAAGGLIGRPPVLNGSGMAQGGRDLIVIENRSSTPITSETREERDQNGRRKTSLILADQVGDAINLPGGGARRTLQTAYGVKPRGTRR